MPRRARKGYTHSGIIQGDAGARGRQAKRAIGDDPGGSHLSVSVLLSSWRFMVAMSELSPK